MITQRSYDYIDTPIHRIWIGATEEAVVHIEMFSQDDLLVSGSTNPILLEAKKQLMEYFDGKRKNFTVPIFQKGTVFQENVWNALCTIPYGETVAYLDIANQINNPKAVRAVGQANRVNQLAILVPCHRVIGKNQQLVGYVGTLGIEAKKILLDLERKNK